MDISRAAILAKIAELEIKLAAAQDALSRYYYAMCLAGWRRMLDKYKKDE